MAKVIIKTQWAQLIYAIPGVSSGSTLFVYVPADIMRSANRDWACQTERCHTLSNKTSLQYIGGEFNNASARRALVDWYLSLFIMCKAWQQYNERPRALALLNLPLV